jgi:hypothetical protein
MRYEKKDYEDYLNYLLFNFKTPAISAGNTIMQDGSYDFLFYSDIQLCAETEYKLISELMYEYEDIKDYNENMVVLTVHEFMLPIIRSRKLGIVLNHMDTNSHK